MSEIERIKFAIAHLEGKSTASFNRTDWFKLMSVYKHGNWWCYDFKLYGRRHRGRGGTTKTEAKRAEAKVKSEALSGLQNISTMKTKYISIESKISLKNIWRAGNTCAARSEMSCQCERSWPSSVINYYRKLILS